MRVRIRQFRNVHPSAALVGAFDVSYRSNHPFKSAAEPMPFVLIRSDPQRRERTKHTPGKTLGGGLDPYAVALCLCGEPAPA